MKRIILLLVLCLLVGCLAGCSAAEPASIAATTLPVYQFTQRLCQGTDISVTRLITENVSCLHEYSLSVNQMQSIESAQAVVISGAGLEEFLDDALEGTTYVIDASVGMELICGAHSHEAASQEHTHLEDPHIWLSPAAAMDMCRNIYSGLVTLYPQHQEKLGENLQSLLLDLQALLEYGRTQLDQLTTRQIITFHDGFSYFAEAFQLEILEAVEEESGSEASAMELTRLVRMVEENNLQVIFTETNGSNSAAQIIAGETGVKIYTLDMAMSGSSYFEAMYHNIDTLKEALG